ncbi:hypothetical protein QCA50_015129 [Cerrena zonata]|uniref:C2H2-type domain-containing protein n=1 Tax=Cerrena zonata TaxID=2478898 RepID=A0AAW0FR79_9APHY
MAAAQPIALPTNTNDYDQLMSSGSFTGQNGSFNPASYTRRFLGSPASFRAGSFGSRFYPGVSPGQILGPLDPNDFRLGKVSSSIESDRGSLINTLNVFERQDELCRDYQCCGVNLTDMHALVDHFEECHVVVVDPFNPQQQAAYRTQPAGVAVPQSSYFSESQNPTVNAVQTYNQGSFDPDDMEIDTGDASAPSSGSSSPPDTPVSTPLSSYPNVHSQQAAHQASRPTPISAFDTTTVLPSRSGHALSMGFPPIRSSVAVSAARAEDAFNAYAGYSDYSSHLPGTVPSSSMLPIKQEDQSAYSNGVYGGRSNNCVPPALLLNSSAGNTPSSTPGPSRVASPTAGPSNYASTGSATNGASSPTSSAAQAARASTTLSRPATSLLLSKPFKCPKPNCNKSYKQANGLKYHMTHGSCNFAPPKDLEQIQALLASKRSQKPDGDNEPISDAELREVEKEAERRLRPYACGVGDCQRRYKNMNGLRYHYQHSGDHGAIGLALLASGQHECLQHTRAHSRTATPTTSTAPSVNASPHATPVVSQAQAVPVQQHATPYVPQQHTLPNPPTYQSQSMMPPTYSTQQYAHYTAPQQQQPTATATPYHPQQHYQQQQQQMSYTMQPMQR